MIYYLDICILGNSNSGKTAFVNRLLGNNKYYNISPTIGVEFSCKEFHIDNDIVRWRLW